jgi:hypothetical protein
MNWEGCRLVRRQYGDSRGDSIELFQTILSVAENVGLDEALACLEQCVIEKRLSWAERNTKMPPNTGNPLGDGYRMFYESYLGLSIPRDGEIIEATDRRLVTRWWNHCPTLVACQRFGLDTREICWKAYHKPVQALLSKVDPRLRFERNYAAIRPYAPYCEEIITLDDSEREIQ